jgi:hypothetical protein
VINTITGLAGFKVGRMIIFVLLLVAVLDSVSYANIKAKSGSPLSISAPNSWPDTCRHLKQWAGISPGTDQGMAKLQYDTLRLYIERCAEDQFSYSVFSSLSAAVQLMSADTTRFEPYRAWLISVLYLNTVQPEYFCACIGAIAGTYQYGKNQAVGLLAVLNYVRVYHRECWNSQGDKEYADDSVAAVQGGYDATHLPPLDSLGLGFLLKSSTPSPTTVGGNYLASFASSPNPFKNETHLRFHLNQIAYTTIGVYDVLGHQVWGDGKGRSLDVGDHEVVVDGSLLPEGSLYARIETGFGEVRTVKLIKTSEP